MQTRATSAKCVFVKQITQTSKEETNSYTAFSNFSTASHGPIETKAASFIARQFHLKEAAVCFIIIIIYFLINEVGQKEVRPSGLQNEIAFCGVDINLSLKR